MSRSRYATHLAGGFLLGLAWTITAVQLNYLIAVTFFGWTSLNFVIGVGSFVAALLLAVIVLKRFSPPAASGLLIETLTLGFFYNFIGTLAATYFSHGL